MKIMMIRKIVENNKFDCKDDQMSISNSVCVLAMLILIIVTKVAYTRVCRDAVMKR